MYNVPDHTSNGKTKMLDWTFINKIKSLRQILSALAKEHIPKEICFLSLTKLPNSNMREHLFLQNLFRVPAITTNLFMSSKDKFTLKIPNQQDDLDTFKFLANSDTTFLTRQNGILVVWLMTHTYHKHLLQATPQREPLHVIAGRTGA
jgi:hypothetical protein